MRNVRRKATRDCIATRGNGHGLPKSSLDGAFETVFPKRPPRSLQRKLSLQGGEQLDALGVIKRRAGSIDQFTAYSRIVAEGWIERLRDDQITRIAQRYEPLVGLGLATRVSGNGGIYGRLPYDAQLLHDFRLANALSQGGSDPDGLQADEATALSQLHKTLQAIGKEPGRLGDPCGHPVPYGVILQADGDRMGALIQEATTVEQSRAISRALQGFAASVRGIVRHYRGHAIYAGGDDVLALLPLGTAVAAAKKLSEDFASAMRDIAQQLGCAEGEYPTLSVGLGVGHLVEPLGALRQRALLAERLAKGDALPEGRRRNALGIILGIRSGGEIEWRAQWRDYEALAELDAFIAAYAEKQLPSRVAYDLRDIALRLRWLTDDSETSRGMRRAEVARMLDRARAQGDTALDPAIKERLLRRSQETPLANLADTLVIARWLAARTRNEVENQ